MSLLRLPDEIIFLISGLFDNPYCLNAFLQTCRRLYLLLNHSLYQGDSPYQIALKWGIENGCERTTQYALEAGAPADKFPLLYVPPTRRSPMQIACRLGNEAIVRLLLDRGVSEDSGIVGMQVAAERGHDEVIRLLVDRGFSPKGPAARGESPLNEAVRGNKLSTVKLLISLGCDPHIPGFFGPSLLFDAASLGHDEILRYLLASENIEPPLVDHLAVCAAASTGKETTLDLLLNYGASPILDRKNLKFLPLVLAAKKNHYVLAERLRGSLDLQSVIACGTPDDIDHKLLFLVSAACGWTDIVADLIDRGCPVDFEEPTYPDLGDRCAHLDCGWFIGQNSRMSPLVLAAHRGCLQVVEKLLNCNADLSAAPKLDAIASAVHGCHIKIIEILLDHSADPQHDRDESRFPVLDNAVQSPDILRLLIDRRVVFDLHQFRDLIKSALQRGKSDALEILTQTIESRGLWDPVIKTWKIPLLGQAAPGGVPMIEFVLDNGFPVDGMDVQRAAEQVLAYPDPEALELLFERGIINSKSRTTRGRSLLDTLASRGVEGVAITATLDILIKHGVDINGASDSPLHRIVGRGMCAYQQNSPWRREVMLRRLLDRGADPLRRCEIHGSPLETAAKDGEQGLLKIMLKTLSQRHVRLDELQPILSLAEKGAEDMRHYMIPPILRRFYWRRRREVELEEAPS